MQQQGIRPVRVGKITGICPSLALGQNLLNRNPNSTITTASGLHPLLRILYAKYASRRCKRCKTILAQLKLYEMMIVWHVGKMLKI